MKYHELKTAKVKRAKRVGRGISAGQGKTAGRGTKGQGSRTGSTAKPGFMGGALPTIQKLPRLPGFKSRRIKAENIHTDQLDRFSGSVDAESLAKAGLISSAYVTVKVLTRGDLTKKIVVKLPAASRPAIAAIEAAGGTFEPTPRLKRPETSKKAPKS
jgi:large subunit ribosomal protein L15